MTGYLPRSDEFEQLLSRLNTVLATEFAGDVPSRRDLLSCQIVGLPRSGTTILHQLIARTGVVGYPSNVMAMFWRAPAVGARLQRQLATLRPSLGLTSLAGRTAEPLDPHEFGYFWRSLLGHDRNAMTTDRRPMVPTRAQDIFDGVTSAFDAPVVYKNFLAPVHVEYLTRSLSRQRFVIVHRDPREVTASLLRTRERIGTPADAWLGPAPVDARATYATVAERVEHQVESLGTTLSGSGLLEHPSAVHVEYAQIVTDPRSAVETVLDLVDATSRSADWGRVPHTLQQSAAR